MPTTTLCVLLILSAQGDDVRDRVVRTDGKEVRGRVVERFAGDEILVVRGGRRIRVPRGEVAEMHTVQDWLSEYLRLRAAAGDHPAKRWALCEWARDTGLPEMAALEALWIVLQDDDHDGAHEVLGHRPHPRHGWVWPVRSRWLPRERHDEYFRDIGHPLELHSEHFTILTDGGPARAIEALIDLERLYEFWFARFGEALQPRESLRRMTFQVWNDESDFASWPVIGMPYFVPFPHADRCYTYFRGEDPRPADLFALATQHLLYHTVARDTDPGGPMERLCAWAEIGLGQWVQSAFRGPPGLAAPAIPQLPAYELQLALDRRRYELDNLIHLTIRDHFYGAILGHHSVHWASVHTFVQFLMDPTPGGDRPKRFLEYLRQALAEAKGDSSRSFDRALGQPIEALQEPWEAWLGKPR